MAKGNQSARKEPDRPSVYIPTARIQVDATEAINTETIEGIIQEAISSVFTATTMVPTNDGTGAIMLPWRAEYGAPLVRTHPEEDGVITFEIGMANTNEATSTEVIDIDGEEE